MKIIKITGDPNDLFSEQRAIVERDGVSKEVRLDIVDRWPHIGEYVIIHAGFAIHTLNHADADANLQLLKQLAGDPNG